VFERDLRCHLDLAAKVQQERTVRHLAHTEAVERGNCLGDRLRMRHIAGIAADIDHQHVGVRLGDIQGGDRATRLSDDAREPRCRCRISRRLHSYGDRIARTRRRHRCLPGEMRTFRAEDSI
jgi:hypothetical protein